MTREQAIQILKYNSNVIHKTINGETDPNEVEALDIAISALEHPERNVVAIVPCGDAISRQEAIDTIKQLYIDLATQKYVIDLLKVLPSVTPQETRWIPVSERLPEKNMGCLVAVGRFNFTEIATYSDLMGIIDHKIFYQGEVGHDNFKNITQYVKAWMPLPESYRG